MRKIPTVFTRDPADMSKVTDEVHPDCQWVLDGEGTATRKYDGTCVMLDKPPIDGGRWWARREVKPGKDTPDDFKAVSTDPNTGKVVGWEPIEHSGFEAHFREAAAQAPSAPGTYELCGPKINRNPEGFVSHRLVRHEDAERPPHQLSHLGATDLVMAVGLLGWEGVVWHHPDGRMAKLKARDYKGVPVPENIAAEVAFITGRPVAALDMSREAVREEIRTGLISRNQAAAVSQSHLSARLVAFASWLTQQASDQVAEGPEALVDRFLAENP